jgi:DNA-binding response OmpR family regulator
MSESRLLIVDDNEDLCNVIVRIFQETGFEASGVYGGRAALDEMSNQQYDLVITDIKMPGMDGLELLSEIRSSYHDIPVVLITGNLEVDSQAMLENVDADAVLYKPFIAEELIATVVKLLA